MAFIKVSWNFSIYDNFPQFKNAMCAN